MPYPLLTPVRLGALPLKNRVIMAPMTRSRAGAGDAPEAISVDYYQQRASAGLIITEGTQPSANGKGYSRTPGIHDANQIKAWSKVANAVTDAGGLMVMQIMHCGRIASGHNKRTGSETVAPSSIQASGQVYTDSHGMCDFDIPRALETEEIVGVIAEYKDATANAYRAGMAGVELHATSGYLPAQFLSTGTNQRTDAYGGSLENRIRFVVETLEAMSSVNGAERVGIRICPGNPFNDLHDDDPAQTFAALLDAIEPLGLAYLHVIRLENGPVDNLALARRHFSGPLIVNDSYDFAEANESIRAGDAEAVSFGRYFVANPDLVERFTENRPLAKFNHKTLYTPGAAGYTDYPNYADACVDD